MTQRNPPLPEQTAQQSYRKRSGTATAEGMLPASRHYSGHQAGIHPEDMPTMTVGQYRQQRSNQASTYPPLEEEDDDLYNTRLPSSVRKYPQPTTAQTRTVMRVTHHPAPPLRASRNTGEQERVMNPPIKPSMQSRFHWLFYIGIGMAAMLALWLSLSGVWQWWQGEQVAMQYGYPRTFQVDADVKHGGMSHFVAINLHGHILVTEIQASDPAQTKVYVGPVFSGAGTDLQPATLTFQDVNGDGTPDMVIMVGTGRYVFINDHRGFRATTPADTIKGVIN